MTPPRSQTSTDEAIDHRSVALLLRVIAVGLALALVVVLAVVIERSQARAHDDAIGRFDDRGTITAELIEGSIAQSAGSTSVITGRLLGGKTVSADQLVDVAGNGLATLTSVAVLDSSGNVLARYPADAPVEFTAGMRRALRDKRVDSSDVVERDGEDVVELYVPFTASDGSRRIYMQGYPKAIAGSIIVQALSAVELPEGGSIYLFDRDGNLLGETGDDPTPGRAISEAAAAGDSEGTAGSRRYVVRSVDHLSFVIVTSAPESAIVADLPSVAGPRIALAALVLALLALLWLSMRAVMDARRIDAARLEAKRANEAKSRFLTYVTHELKTPIAVIRGFSDLLDRSELDERQHDQVAHITESGNHLSLLVDELLDVARIESGKVNLTLEDIDVRVIIDEVLVLAGPLADERGIQLEPPAGDGRAPWVHADPLRVRQVLLNLVSNAIKYNDEGGVVRLTVEPEDEDTLRVSVADDGPGLAPDVIGRLFDPFDRLGAEAGPVAGSGLGLVVSKGLVEAMDGSMHVHSELGSGCVFGFDLPIARPR